MVIGFWNIKDKNLSDNIIDFVSEYQIDILYLAEANDITVLDFIKKSKKIIKTRVFNQLDSQSTKITLLTSLNPSLFENKKQLYSSPRWLAYQLKIPTVVNLNIISVHFHSKVNWSSQSLALECTNLSRDILNIEKDTKCDNTILIGDFNMNPFEDGIVAANGLNAIQDFNYSKTRERREIDGVYYNYFYNPMWKFFGDDKKPLGTHYCRVPGHISHEWNIYDQIMFRPSVKQYLLNIDYVEIVDKIGAEKLTKRFDRPDDKKYSDHLPIILKFKI